MHKSFISLSKVKLKKEFIGDMQKKAVLECWRDLLVQPLYREQTNYKLKDKSQSRKRERQVSSTRNF